LSLTGKVFVNTRTREVAKPRSSSRSRRDDILRVATKHFGRDGYEDSMWADVAAEVGIGSTALYHYFESKLHCLYVIMGDALATDLRLFEETTRGSDDYVESLVTVLRSLYDLSEQDILRNRVLLAEMFLVGVHRTSPREEEARQRARALTRDIELAWATFLTRGMERGVIPETDPRLMSRAVLGLHNSVWLWFHPRGTLTLAEVSEFYVRRCLAVVGVDPAFADDAKPKLQSLPGKQRSASK
jgi:TetR/AcrR family transcriptional regulator, cholesterol catabolism regulator